MSSIKFVANNVFLNIHCYDGKHNIYYLKIRDNSNFPGNEVVEKSVKEIRTVRVYVSQNIDKNIDEILDFHGGKKQLDDHIWTTNSLLRVSGKLIVNNNSGFTMRINSIISATPGSDFKDVKYE